jgi:hypothetical protein
MNDPKLERCKQVIKQYEENQSKRSSISQNVIKKINKETPKKIQRSNRQKRNFLDIVKDYFPYEVLFS